MGNSTSSGRGPHDETVDFGALVPQGVYTGARDWNQQIVGQLIADRRLAPFYRPLEDYEDAWDDAAILAHRRAPPPPPADEDGGEAHVPPPAPAPSRIHHKRGSTAGKEKEGARLNEAALYRGAVECPICFLVRPRLLCPRPTPPLTTRGASTTHPTSTTRAAATRRSAPNASYRSSVPSRTPSTSSPNPPRARTASAPTLASCTSRPRGVRASAARAACVLCFLVCTAPTLTLA
jgi:hypothetical protein